MTLRQESKGNLTSGRNACDVCRSESVTVAELFGFGDEHLIELRGFEHCLCGGFHTERLTRESEVLLNGRRLPSQEYCNILDRFSVTDPLENFLLSLCQLASARKGNV